MKNWSSIKRTFLNGLVCTIIALSVNIIVFSYVWYRIPEDNRSYVASNLGIRFILFFFISSGLIGFNQFYMKNKKLVGRIIPSLLYTIVSFVLYKIITYYICVVIDHFFLVLAFQFFLINLVGMFLGYTIHLNDVKVQKEKELEALRIESLQSRCDALTNQINPHFFFNSLNGISSLVRKKDDKVTLDYIDHLSDIFRYILQSENKGLVTLDEELEFARSFTQVIKVRYAGKLDVEFDIPDECLNLKIPVLALLPLIENVSVHNMIDSEHLMHIRIFMNDKNELVVSNPIFPKQYKPETHGTGIANLRNRFMLLLDENITVENANDMFNVILPLGK